MDEINPKILDKLKEIKENDMSGFLKDIIHFEFQNIDQDRTLFGEEYDKLIKKYLGIK